jgi:hypothetical protein
MKQPGAANDSRFPSPAVDKLLAQAGDPDPHSRRAGKPQRVFRKSAVRPVVYGIKIQINFQF